MKPYPNYKDSGQLWLGAVPEHWKTYRLKYAANVSLSNVDKHSIDGEVEVRLCNYTDVYYNAHITDAIEFMAATAPPSQVEKFQLRAGDVLMTKDSETPADIGVPAVVDEELEGVLCGYHLAMLRPRKQVSGAYLRYVLASPPFRDHFRMSANGVTRFGLSNDDITTALTLVPPVVEQAAIVAFLDHKTTAIEGFIGKKRQLIALLNEQKAAIINRAVTKGLNPDVPMKASGVEWLREVPAHWDVVPLKRRWTVTDCKHLTVEFVDEGIPVASIGEVKEMRINLISAKRTTENEFFKLIEGNRQPRLGDIIYSRNATVGEAAFVDTDVKFCMGQDVSLIRSVTQNQRFLVYQLRSPFVLHQLDQAMIGSTFRRINVSDIKMLLVCCPPPNEQNAIVHTLDSELQTFQETISKAEREIELIQEYRATLISDAVTGKIDVRGVTDAENTAVNLTR